MTPLDHSTEVISRPLADFLDIEEIPTLSKNGNPPAESFFAWDGEGVDGRSCTAIDAKGVVSCCLNVEAGSGGVDVSDASAGTADGVRVADDLRGANVGPSAGAEVV